LNEEKLDKYKSKYYEVIKQGSDEQPYMYMTHYSSSGIVLYYLIRNVPSQILRLQNGGFGPADRIFFDIEMCWNNWINIFSDLKELIPEFYTGSGDFLSNRHNCELGINHLGEKVEDVVLPNWAESKTDFIMKMRQALESEHVTRNLHNWIDMIFGDKQKGEKAFYANNLFYPLTYEENVKLDECSNEFERSALELQIQGFGQTPKQIFNSSHPQNLCRKILISQPSQVNQETVDALRKEIEEMKEELSKVNKRHEENINKQLKKFEIIDTKRKKKTERYKKEKDDQIEGYKTLIDQYKQK